MPRCPAFGFLSSGPVRPPLSSRRYAPLRHRAGPAIAGAEGTNTDADEICTQIFRSGAVEATKAPIAGMYQGKKYIPSGPLERDVFESLPYYVKGLRDLGVPPPLIMLITLEGVKDAAYKVHNSIFDDPEPVIERDVVFLPNVSSMNTAKTLSTIEHLKPAFDALWNTAGCVSAQTFSADGVWIGNAQKR